MGRGGGYRNEEAVDGLRDHDPVGYLVGPGDVVQHAQVALQHDSVARPALVAGEAVDGELADGDAVRVLAMAGCCVLVTLGIVRSRTANGMCLMVVLAGLILGPIFPTLIAILLSNVDPSLHGRAVGIFFCIGGIGWTVIPMMIGAYAQRTTVQRAFVIATGSATLLTLLSTLLWFQLQ